MLFKTLKKFTRSIIIFSCYTPCNWINSDTFRNCHKILASSLKLFLIFMALTCLAAKDSLVSLFWTLNTVPKVPLLIMRWILSNRLWYRENGCKYGRLALSNPEDKVISSSEDEVHCRDSKVSEINLTLRMTRNALKRRYHLLRAKHRLIHMVSSVWRMPKINQLLTYIQIVTYRHRKNFKHSITYLTRKTLGFARLCSRSRFRFVRVSRLLFDKIVLSRFHGRYILL